MYSFLYDFDDKTLTVYHKNTPISTHEVELKNLHSFVLNTYGVNFYAPSENTSNQEK